MIYEIITNKMIQIIRQKKYLVSVFHPQRKKRALLSGIMPLQSQLNYIMIVMTIV
jgi:hypothetical protein